MHRFLLFGLILLLCAAPLGAENRYVIGGQTFLTGSTGFIPGLAPDRRSI